MLIQSEFGKIPHDLKALAQEIFGPAAIRFWSHPQTLASLEKESNRHQYRPRSSPRDAPLVQASVTPKVAVASIKKKATTPRPVQPPVEQTIAKAEFSELSKQLVDLAGDGQNVQVLTELLASIESLDDSNPVETLPCTAEVITTRLLSKTPLVLEAYHSACQRPAVISPEFVRTLLHEPGKAINRDGPTTPLKVVAGTTARPGGLVLLDRIKNSYNLRITNLENGVSDKLPASSLNVPAEIELPALFWTWPDCNATTFYRPNKALPATHTLTPIFIDPDVTMEENDWCFCSSRKRRKQCALTGDYESSSRDRQVAWQIKS